MMTCPSNFTKTSSLVVVLCLSVYALLFFKTLVLIPVYFPAKLRQYLNFDTKSIDYSNLLAQNKWTLGSNQSSLQNLSGIVINTFSGKSSLIKHKQASKLTLNPESVQDAKYLFRPDVCANREITLVICVPIARHLNESRSTIRETMGTYSKMPNSTVILVFFVGIGHTDEELAIQETIDHEVKQHQDVVQGDFIDTYKNPTLKSLLIMDWVSKFCNHSSFIVKADDDTYVNIPLMTKKLNRISGRLPGRPFVLGNVQIGTKPSRNKNKKWYVSIEEFSEEHYPFYTSGTCYAMTTSAAAAIHTVSKSLTPLWLEDVFITGICRRKAKVEILNDGDMVYFKRKDTQFQLERIATIISMSSNSNKELRMLHNIVTSSKEDDNSKNTLLDFMQNSSVTINRTI